jgi:hypothetical protein
MIPYRRPAAMPRGRKALPINLAPRERIDKSSAWDVPLV